jgi:hypothetical protein
MRDDIKRTQLDRRKDMTDWTKQTEEMFKSWNEAQTRLMEGWRESLKKLGVPQDTEIWGKSIQTFEETVEKSLQAQQEWTHSWIENLSSMEGIPEQAQKSADRFREMSDQWLATQGDLWGNWFKMLKSFDPSSLSGNWMDMFRDPLQAWQNATEKVLETQSTWIKTWLGSQEKSEE